MCVFSSDLTLVRVSKEVAGRQFCLQRSNISWRQLLNNSNKSSYQTLHVSSTMYKDFGCQLVEKIGNFRGSAIIYPAFHTL